MCYILVYCSASAQGKNMPYSLNILRVCLLEIGHKYIFTQNEV